MGWFGKGGPDEGGGGERQQKATGRRRKVVQSHRKSRSLRVKKAELERSQS